MTAASRDRDEIVEVIGWAVDAEAMASSNPNLRAIGIRKGRAALRGIEAKWDLVEKVSASHGIRHRREGFEDGTGSRSRAPHPSRDATKDTA